MNQSFCELLGYDEAELIGRKLQEITHPDDLSANALPQARLLRGEISTFTSETRYIHKLGHVVWTVLAVSLVRDTSRTPVRFLSQITDITARHTAEDALARHATGLEHANVELERSNRELDEFAYVASHDLQAPLRTIASYVQLLAENYTVQLDTRAKRWIGYVSDGAVRMQRRVNDLLSLARVRTDGASHVLTDTSDCVARAWDRLQEEQTPLDAHLAIALLPMIDADDTQIEQLFYNLFDNAVKYRRPEIALTLDVSAERDVAETEGSWRFAVRDNGLGVDPSESERVFEIFYRAPQDAGHEGAGIGLAICKRIVERHGGRMWIESGPGAGATIMFTLAEHAA